MSELADHKTPWDYVAFELGEVEANLWCALVEAVRELDRHAARFLDRWTKTLAFTIRTGHYRETQFSEIKEIQVLEFVIDSDDEFDRLRTIWSLLDVAARKVGIDRIQVTHIEEGIGLLLIDPDMDSMRAWWPSEEDLRQAAERLKSKDVVSPSSPVPTRVIDGFELSPIEVPVYEYLRDTDLTFSPQCKIVAGGKVKYRVDFMIWFKGRAFALEVDGHEFHKSREDRNRDSARDRFLMQRGITPIRFTGSQIHADLSGCMMELVDCLTGQRSGEI